jgi:hypothetical protein
MSTFLIVLLSIGGFMALIIGGLIVLWFYQGGCCVRRIKHKISRRDYIQPVIHRSAGSNNA